MYEKIHRWSEEDGVAVPTSDEMPPRPDEPLTRDDIELVEIVGHRVRDISSDDD